MRVKPQTDVTDSAVNHSPHSGLRTVPWSGSFRTFSELESRHKWNLKQSMHIYMLIWRFRHLPLTTMRVVNPPLANSQHLPTKHYFDFPESQLLVVQDQHLFFWGSHQRIGTRTLYGVYAASNNEPICEHFYVAFTLNLWIYSSDMKTLREASEVENHFSLNLVTPVTAAGALQPSHRAHCSWHFSLFPGVF